MMVTTPMENSPVEIGRVAGLNCGMVPAAGGDKGFGVCAMRVSMDASSKKIEGIKTAMNGEKWRNPKSWMKIQDIRV